MYLDYYRLQEKPFSLSPDPRYLYYSASHKEAYAQFIYAMTEQCGYMVLTGEVGTGKTTLINAMLQSLTGDVYVANVYHTVLSPKGLLQNICREYGVPYKGRTMAELIFELNEFLQESFNRKKKCILILDEAQNLSENVLEEIRLLSNFEATSEKYFQILLVGQPELDEKLESTTMRHLRDRISLRFRLSALSQEETKLYMRHRLRIAGRGNIRTLFSDGAITRICKLSGGIPRRINKLCDQLLLLGYARKIPKIDGHMLDSFAIGREKKREDGSSLSVRHELMPQKKAVKKKNGVKSEETLFFRKSFQVLFVEN